MSATVIRIPVCNRPNFYSTDWREQFEREFAATWRAMQGDKPPHRTRPLLVIDNERIAHRTLKGA